MKYEIEIKQACEGFWSCISPDAWIQSIGGLIGTFLGAFIAAWISIRILKSQFNHENKKELKNEYNMLMKFNEKYSRIVSPIMANLTIIEGYKKEANFEAFIGLVDVNFQMAKELKNIDTTSLSYKVEDKVNMLNREIQMVMLHLALIRTADGEINIDILNELKDRYKEFLNYEKMLKESISQDK
ncbi:hypothetical protein [Peribacillus sp. FSL M8-0224]|uniref:hypothetical protein n=1 Tax=Peribacillus sp. FSL M8-0224 TaxID=2921568 RepID=UPI0030FC0DF5